MWRLLCHTFDHKWWNRMMLWMSWSSNVSSSEIMPAKKQGRKNKKTAKWDSLLTSSCWTFGLDPAGWVIRLIICIWSAEASNCLKNTPKKWINIYTSRWFQPIWKICSSNSIICPGRDENWKYLKPPPRISIDTTMLCDISSTKTVHLFRGLLQKKTLKKPSTSGHQRSWPQKKPEQPGQFDKTMVEAPWDGTLK